MKLNKSKKVIIIVIALSFLAVFAIVAIFVKKKSQHEIIKWIEDSGGSVAQENHELIDQLPEFSHDKAEQLLEPKSISIEFYNPPPEGLIPKLNQLDKLTELYFMDRKSTVDLNGLDNISLGELILTSEGKGLKGLGKLKNLESLSVVNIKNEEFQNLLTLKKLKKLWLSECKEINLKNIKRLKNLKFLAFNNCSLTQMELIASLSNLEELIVDGANFKDINFISKLKKLKVLYLNNCEVDDLSPIKSIGKFDALSFTNSKVADLSTLMELEELKELRLFSKSIPKKWIMQLPGIINKFPKIKIITHSQSFKGKLSNSLSVDECFKLGMFFEKQDHSYYDENKIPKSAIGFYEVSASKGHLESIHKVAYFYRKELQYSIAMDWYQKAIPLGSEISEKYIGLMYLKGSSELDKDIANGIEYVSKAAERGDLKSNLLIATIYLDGLEELQPNIDKATLWYKKYVSLGGKRRIPKLEKIINKN